MSHFYIAVGPRVRDPSVLAKGIGVLKTTLGLYSDANESALARVVGFCRRAGSAALGIQLAHAGRKGSAKLPWEGGGPLAPDADPF